MSASDMDKSMRTPLARARGLGSAKDGVHHWWMQRLTAVALALLTPWFLWTLVSLIGVPHPAVAHMLGDPRRALPMLAFVLALFWHARLGLQVVIEDYVHTRWMELALQVLASFACAAGALTCVYAIVRILFAP
ncbi:MAG TPA: succinate dehydrogenase, hydrophobic membrane anchor protein [Xanthomonadaceae bacterium]|jgi:succinate dehydrogenase / fumarate reductase membrane anchor subunit